VLGRLAHKLVPVESLAFQGNEQVPGLDLAGIRADTTDENLF
jgi:hypothetical protein